MEQTNYETATFGAGCFWGVEAAYRQMISDWRRTRGAGATTGERR